MKTKEIKTILTAFLTFLFALNLMSQEHKKNAEMEMDRKEFNSFLYYEMQFPKEDIINKVKGTVKLCFRVDSTGMIDEIEVAEPLTPTINNEAIRLLKLIRYKPAFIGGKNISSYNCLDITFNYKKYQKTCKQRGYDKIDYIAPVDESSKVYLAKNVEQIPKPQFNNQNINLSKFIVDNMKYPETAFNQNISGTVKLGFIVEKSGNVTHTKVINPVGGGCDQEAIRILKLLNWKPGVKHEKLVRTYMTLDFTFGLKNALNNN